MLNDEEMRNKLVVTLKYIANNPKLNRTNTRRLGLCQHVLEIVMA